MRVAAALAVFSAGLGVAPAALAQGPIEPAAQPPLTAAPSPPEPAPSDPAPAASPNEADLASYPQDALRVYDPLEGWNRGVFALNNVVDKAALEPIARVYRAATPTFFRDGVRNTLDNLAAPVTFANDVLQGKPKRAGTTVARFGVNSTIGLLGFFDVAESMGLKDHDEDFGQTLGVWGAGGGPYLVVPFLGPSNLRDLGGRIVDVGLDPFTYAEFREDDLFRTTRTGLTFLTARTDTLDLIENVRKTSDDPYVTLRSFYAQSRASQIRDGQENVQDLPDFGDPM